MTVNDSEFINILKDIRYKVHRGYELTNDSWARTYLSNAIGKLDTLTQILDKSKEGETK